MSHYVKTNEPTWKGIYFHLVERDDDEAETNLFKASLFLGHSQGSILDTGRALR